MAGAPSAFDRLSPFIQEFIWKHGWTEMREVQVRAATAVFDTDKHLLLASGTASGKTEAAFLPILTQLYENPASTVGVLYIGPLKALINDQFLRLGDLCVEADIPVTAWHGDVAAGMKKALLKQPRGILQITPEALEGLVLNRSGDLMRLFGDLRWVVIDELHAFMASDRGGQVLSLLDRLARYAVDTKRLPRRAGLSATLGDYADAASWLEGETKRGVELVADDGSRTVFIAVDNFSMLPKPRRDSSTSSHDHDGSESDEQEEDLADADAMIRRAPDLYREIYDATQRRKSLIFANSRSDTEEVVGCLRRLSELAHTQDIYFVHHGSIAAPLREAAEAAMREPNVPACTAATVTLELGIDLGQLDRVLQLGTPPSVASFLQRMGRAGRRGQRPEMFFLLREEGAQDKAHLLERIPWQLLHCIALIQLYAEDHWLEPLCRDALPASLLYHQTMSVAAAFGEITPSQLAARVLTLSPFAHVSQDDFRSLLLHLVKIDHLQQTDEGGLILGLDGERVVRNFRFLATFADTTEWSVKDGSRDIGTVASPVPVGERVMLAGRTWEVMQIMDDQKVLVVRRVRGVIKTRFLGSGYGAVHDRVVDRMRRALVEDAVYPYLSERAADRLREARALARSTEIANGPCLVPLGGNKIALLPWAGTHVVRTLSLHLNQSQATRATDEDFYLTFSGTAAGPDETERALREAALPEWSAAEIVAPLSRALLVCNKYDEFVPDSLLRRAFAGMHLDANGARAVLRQARLLQSRGPA
jgi:ATP-dependent Lhr-like helicase